MNEFVWQLLCVILLLGDLLFPFCAIGFLFTSGDPIDYFTLQGSLVISLFYWILTIITIQTNRDFKKIKAEFRAAAQKRI